MPAFAGAPTLSGFSPTGGPVSPSTDFSVAAADTGTGVAAVLFEFSTSSTGPWATFATAVTPGSDGKYHGIWNAPPPADGTYFVRADASDTTAGNPASAQTTPVQVTLDATPPTLDVTCSTASGDGAPSGCSWFTSDSANVEAVVSVGDNGSGIKEAWYTTDGSDPLSSGTRTALSATVTNHLPAAGPPDPTFFKAAAVDNAGNTTTTSFSVQWDDTAPPAPHVTLGAGSSNAFVQQLAADSYKVWYNPNVSGAAVLTVPANDDPESGVGSVSFKTDVSGSVGWGVGTFTPLSGTYTWDVSPAGPPPSFPVQSTNRAFDGVTGAPGATGPPSSVVFSPDKDAPTGGVTCVPAGCTNPAGPVQVTVQPNDNGGSGVQQVRYTTDGTDPTATTGTVGTSVLVTTPNTTVKFWGIDNVGNSEILATQPVGEASSTPQSATTSSSPSAATVTVGTSVHDTATVSPNGFAVTPTGTVTFSLCGPLASAAGCPTGGAPVGQARTLDGSGKATSGDVIPSAAGTWCFRADYSGDQIFAASSDGTVAECFTVTAGGGPAGTTTVSLEAIADATVRSASPDANFGTGADYLDSQGGTSTYACGADNVPITGPQYSFIKWDLSNIPAGAKIVSAKVVLTTRSGFAWDGDPDQHLLDASNLWTESGITWSNAPAPSGTDLSQAFIWYGGPVCGDPKGAPVAQTFTGGAIAKYLIPHLATDKLFSVEVFNNNCSNCTVAPNGGYWVRFYSREATDKTLRPQLLVTYATAQTGSVFTVNTAADHDDGTCSTDDCTLREAINAANASDVPATIKFAIGAGGPQTIFPTSPLPAITAPTTIDGTTQPGFLATPVITIDGSQLDGASDGIVIQAANSTVRGLAIDNFSLGATGGIGIHVLADDATIAGNFLGVDASGTIAASNGGDGVRVENAANATIGGPADADRNVVAGNGGHGIFLASSTGSTVEGNYSGFDAHGGSAIPNGLDGIAVDGGGQNVIVGNVSSGNTHQGIALFGVNFGATSGDTVRGNDTGTAPREDGLIPNGGDGILVASGTGHIIGGSAQGQGNFSEGNGGAGVHLANESGAVVAGNTVKGNDLAGVQIDANAPKNSIGVGGAGNGLGNTITGNGGAGVSVLSSGNAILANSIDTNGKGGGIDLHGVGNALQQAPALGSAQQSGTTLQISGKFLSPGGTYRIEFFVSPTCGPQGVTFVAPKIFTVGPAGEIAVGAKVIGVQQLQGSFVTATATSSSNNTSAFSNCVQVKSGGTATSSDLSLTTDVASTLPGAAAVPLADIPQSAFGKTTIDSNGNPVPPPIGLGSIGLGSIGLGSIGLGSIGLGSIDLGSTGLGSIGLGSIGLTDTTLLENGLGGIPLNTLPLKPPLSWESALSSTTLAGLPIQTLTVKDVLDRAPSTLAGIGLGSIDLSHSGLGSIGLGSIALGSIGLGSIPIDGGWCAFIHSIPGFASYDCTGLDSKTVLQVALEGVPVSSGLGSIGLGSIDLSSTGLGSIGLGSIDIADSGLGSIGLGSIGLGSIGLGSIGLGSIDLAGTGLGSIGLGSINLTASGLGSIGLGSIGTTLPDVVDCTQIDCSTATLGAAAALGLIKPTATLGDLAGYLATHASQFTLADLGYYGDVTLGDLAPYLTGTLADLLPGLPPTATVDDLLSALLGGNVRDWENTPLAGLAAFAGAPGATGGLVTYTAAFTIHGSGAAAVATLTVTPPAGAFYVPGSAQLVNGTQTTPLGDPLRGGGGLSWTLDSLAYETQYGFTFKLRPGLQLGPEQTSVTLSTAGAPDVTKPASVNVTDTNESNDSATTNAAPINPATLYLSFLGNGKDVDYYTLHVDAAAAPAGTQIKLFLSHLHSDDDIAVYGPGEPALRGSGLGSIGLGSIGLGSIAPGEQPVEPGEESQSLQSDPAQDLPATALPAGDQLVGVSNNRGTASEEVDLVSTGQSQDLLIQVSSYDGNPTTDPYLLRVEYDKPPALPACSQTAPGGTGTTEATLPTNASIPASAQTLILYNEKRFAQYYGQTNAHDVYTRLVTYAGQSTVNGVIVPVELNGAVAAAYTTWDQNLCSPAAANGVVKAIGTLLDTLQANHPKLSSIVLVGADNVIPFGRLLDQTLQANEVGFRSNFGFVNNQYVGAVAAGYLFSDDPYGDPSPRQFGSGFLYTPKYALGRLVEKPGEIEKQLDAYDNVNHGVINPTSKLVSGYDFLTDGAQAVDSALPGTDTATNLINDSWTADALRADFLPPATPVIDSLNAHYDQHQALSAAGNAAHDESAPNLFTTTDVPADSVLGRIVFTMGCHSGFSLFDDLTYFPNPATTPLDFTKDWPQAYAAGGAIAFMGNTGYGLGDTTAVAYSERLNQLFAQRLNGTMTLGQALAFAKQEYFGDLGVVGTYDQKVVNEATLYGLPTYRLGTGTPPAAPPALPTYTDPATGLTAADFTAQPQFMLTSSPLAHGGSYYRTTNDPNGLGVQVTNRRPIEPLTSLDVTEAGTTAHGVFITSLVSENHTPFQVSFGRVAVASSLSEPQLTGISDFPAQIQSLVNVNTPNGPRQRAVLVAGHFASGAAGNVGTQRNYTTIGGTVLYSNSADFVRPTITNMQVVQAGSTVGFSADVTDLLQNGGPGTVTEAIVLYLDGSGVWQRANLACTNGHCSGGGPLTGTSVDYIVEAVDASGNVGVNANKAAARDITPPSSGGGHINLSLNPSTTTNGWITGSPATAAVSSDAGATLSTSLDGAPYTGQTNVPVSGDGLHILAVRGSDGSSATFAIPVDTLPPTITFFTPFLLAGDRIVYSCSDAGSGIAATNGCVGSVPSGTVSSGNQTVTVTARDNVGHTSSQTLQVWQWTGFLPPVDNPPTLNVAKAGNSIPVKFSLGGNRGLNFLAPNSPSSQQVSCDSTAPVDTIETTVTAGQSSLSYDATSNTYTYAWKTDKAWASTCRELTLTFASGDVRKAEFKFTK